MIGVLVAGWTKEERLLVVISQLEHMPKGSHTLLLSLFAVKT